MNYWRGNTNRGVQTSSFLSCQTGPFLYLHPRTAPWLPSRLIVLGHTGGRVEQRTDSVEQLHIRPCTLCSRLLLLLKHRVPGAASWKLNKSVRIFRYSKWQIIFWYLRLGIFLMTFLARLSSRHRRLGRFCSDTDTQFGWAQCLWSYGGCPE